MEDNNQVNVTDNTQPTENIEVANQQPEEVQDPRLIHPIIIGELRKEKIGKPIMIVELFLLFGIVFAALPFINSLLNDENSKLYQLLHPGYVPASSSSSNSSNNQQNKDNYLDGTKVNLLSADAAIKFKGIIVKDISLSAGSVKCTISAYSGQINLDDYDYYLEVSSSSNEVLASVKLTGSIDVVEKQVEFNVFGIQFNPSMPYQGKFVEMGANDYPKYDLSGVDERGFASMVCTKGSRTITYGFQNDCLITINDSEMISKSGLSNDQYINTLDLYQKKRDNLGTTISSVEEVEDGIKFSANIDLNGYKIPKSVADNNYYLQDTKVNKIAYAQKGKGFDCK